MNHENTCGPFPASPGASAGLVLCRGNPVRLPGAGLVREYSFSPFVGQALALRSHLNLCHRPLNLRAGDFIVE